MNDELISRSALKKSLNFVYDCDYIGSKSKEGIASDIIEEIDNAPTVEYTFEEAFQKTVCEQRLYCPERPTGEWQLHGMIYYCSKCGHECGESGDNFCGNCGADMRGKKKNEHIKPS